MPLPDLIEIIPLEKPVRAEIAVPGSKSITNRALVLAALADGEVTLEGALWSEDTQVMVEALVILGFEVKVENDPTEFSNRRISVKGQGGKIPNAGTAEMPLELLVGNAGTAARFLAAMVCLGNGAYRLSGVPRMHERPQAELFKALRELGYRVDSPNDKLPATIFGRADQPVGPDAQQRVPTKRSCTVSITESSQFASALLLSAKHGWWHVKVAGEDSEEAPYVTMTLKLIKAFPWSGGRFQIEPDASSGSYFWAAGWLMHGLELRLKAHRAGRWSGSPVFVKSWPETAWQIDENFPDFIPLPATLSRSHELGDSIMTAIILAADRDAATAWGKFTSRTLVRFMDLGRLRVQECERVVALRTELTKCGAIVIEEGDSLAVYPCDLNGAEIETYNDHRMAMCFATLGLKVPGIKLKNPTCVKKTFPNFFQKLSGRLGVRIRDASTGRELKTDELFAD